jgi:hypothetical protein
MIDFSSSSCDLDILMHSIWVYRGLINKMIRYVSEKEVEVEPPSPQTKTHSPQRSVQLIHPHPSPSEHNLTSSHALKDLKKINDQS